MALNFIDKQMQVPKGAVPVGYVVPDTQVLLLDDDGQEVPPTEVGEIAVKSRYLSPGYWRKPELTREVFLPDPEGGDERIYRTGDLGRMERDGCLVHLERKDLQVKVRGHRVEVAEIEMALLDLENVKEATVVARTHEGSEQRLVAYLVPAIQPPPSVSAVRAALAKKLPNQMIPSAFVTLDAFPLTPNGKLDRRALPAPDQGRPELEIPFVRPRTLEEETLAGIWTDVLGIDRVGIHDDFMELGGDSLLAAAMLVQLEEALGKKLPLAIMFEASTVAQLAQVLRHDKWSAPQSLIPIQPQGSKPPFFCVHGAGGHVLNYKALARHLGDDQPFYGLEAPGRDGEQHPLTEIEALAAHHIDEIRTVQPEGPYFLGGHSMGGVVAYEMAQQLQAQGQEIGLVVLLDSGCPTLVKPSNSRRHPVQRLINLSRRVAHHCGNLLELTPRGQVRYVKEKARRAKKKRIPTDSKVRQANKRATRSYVTKACSGPVALMWASEGPEKYLDPRLGWRELVGEGLEVHAVPGDHLTMLTEPHIQVLAQRLTTRLDAAQTVKASDVK